MTLTVSFKAKSKNLVKLWKVFNIFMNFTIFICLLFVLFSIHRFSFVDILDRSNVARPILSTKIVLKGIMAMTHLWTHLLNSVQNTDICFKLQAALAPLLPKHPGSHLCRGFKRSWTYWWGSRRADADARRGRAQRGCAPHLR